MEQGDGETIKIPAEIKLAVPSSLKIVFALVEWVIPQNVIVLMGRLQKSDVRGVGLTLTLVEKQTGQIIANRTIWQQDYDLTPTTPKDKDTDAYYRLAQLAASWALFRLSAWQQNPIRPLGTENWRSYACLQAGVDWRLQGETVKARRMFMETLDGDPRNRGALFKTT